MDNLEIKTVKCEVCSVELPHWIQHVNCQNDANKTSILKCLLCSVEIPNDEQMRLHVAGKKHKKNLNNKNTVGGIKCELCSIELPNESSMQQHVAGQKHQKLFNAKEEERRLQLKCGIFVKGYPQDLTHDLILSYFAKFGKIVWHYFGHNFLLLDYSDPSSAKQVLSTRHFLGGRSLLINYRQQRPQITVKESKPIEDLGCVIEKLKLSTSFAHQVELFTECIRETTSGNFIKYNNICKDLNSILYPYFPNHTIYPFGSSVTGLHLWNSDIDIYISGIRKPGDEDIGYLYKLRRILTNSNYFANVFVIGQAKIPILKCVHTLTETNCDVNLRNMLGVCNSELIKYYLSIDPKLKPLILIIKYWAKAHRITGQNHLFTNYSLCLMVIFFLQGNPYCIPSVQILQEDPKFVSIHETWNGGFKPTRVYSSKLWGASLLELLTGFFTYYSKFDYNSYVICPYLGVQIEKSLFKCTDKLPNFFKTYIEYIGVEGNRPLKVEASICVQDPFEHSRNTTPIVSDSTLNIFTNFCHYGKKLCETGEESLLYKLFMHDPPNVDVELLIQANFSQFGITMGNNVKYLSNDTEDISTLQELWFKSVNNFTVTVLKDFLNLKVEEIEADQQSKKAKLDGQSDVYTRPGMLIASYKCSGKLNVWNSRKITLKSSEKELDSIIDKETQITKQLVDLYKDYINSNNIIEFQILLEKKIEPTQVVFSLTKIESYKKTFKIFCDFFTNKLGTWFETYEKEMNNKSVKLI